MLFNTDILECIVGHLYHPDAVRVRIAQKYPDHGQALPCVLYYTFHTQADAPVHALQLLAVCKTLQSIFRSSNIEHRPRLLVIASEANHLCEIDLLSGVLGRTWAIRSRARWWKRLKGSSLQHWPTCVATSPDGYIHICQYKVICPTSVGICYPVFALTNKPTLAFYAIVAELQSTESISQL